MSETSVIIPNEPLPKKVCGCNLYSLGIPRRYLIGSLDTRPEWCELEEKQEE